MLASKWPFGYFASPRAQCKRLLSGLPLSANIVCTHRERDPLRETNKSVDDALVADACTTLHAGGVIAYPTEAVWGLGCDPFNQAAFVRLLNLKQREADKGVILVAAGVEQLGRLLDALTTQQRERLAKTPDQPTTWLVPVNSQKTVVPEWITGKHNSVAIRISTHPIVSALCSTFGNMIVSTSANLAGQTPAASESDLRAVFGDNIDVYVAGELGGYTRPSQIIDLETMQVLR